MMNHKKYQRQYFLPPYKCMKWAEKDYVDKYRRVLEKFHKARIAVWGILWQIIIIVLSVVILYLLYEAPFDVIEVLEDFIMDYCYGNSAKRKFVQGRKWLMNILVIGNGFDLAHGLPKKYMEIYGRIRATY